MKRLIPAAIILILLISVCIGSHIYVDRACEKTLIDINAFQDKKISASTLENFWKERKEQMGIFVNHSFLDKISLYIGQLTLSIEKDNSSEFDTVYKNIETLLELIKAEQKLALHSFY